MVRRLSAMGLGLVVVATFAMPSVAGAQTIGDYPIELPTTTTTTTSTTSTSVLPDEETTTTTTEAPTTTTSVLPDEVVPPTQPPPAVKGDVVSRPLPRTGNDIGGTAVFGGALTVLGIALALGARRRRNSFESA